LHMIRLIQGDCRHVLSTLPDESVHCVVTSPPYWGLRDYNVNGQVGLEPTITDYVTEMVAIFREVKRVLRSDGTLWLNLGDSYSINHIGRRDHGTGSPTSRLGPNKDGLPNGTEIKASNNKLAQGLKPKDLCGIPWRVAFALQDDGWYLRQGIIWNKPNPMPESVTDRCTKSHEYIFLLSKSEKYYYDAVAIAEPTHYPEGSWGRSKCYDGDQTGKLKSFYGNGAQWKGGQTRNKRSVWTIATTPFSKAHFATFPPLLITPMIKAGTSERGCCSKCGATLERTFNKKLVPGPKAAKTFILDKRDIEADKNDQGSNRQKDGHKPGWINKTTTTGWQPTCICNKEIIPCTVLDIFGGAGTTAVVASGLGRSAISIELNPDYIKMARDRLPRLFADVSSV
jgi:DNA modification methylase